MPAAAAGHRLRRAPPRRAPPRPAATWPRRAPLRAQILLLNRLVCAQVG